MSTWDNLSMAERAEVMRLAVEGGVYDLDAIRNGYNEYAKGGKKEDEQYYSTMEKVAEDNYKDWGFSNPDEALLHALNDNTYNYRGYYGKYPQSRANATTHWTDEFKTVYHPTFSQESIYSGQKSQYNPLGLPGGFWSGDTFIPMAWQLDANEYKKGGGIHIKPSKKGTFTAAASKHGMGVQQFASRVLAHPENYSPAMRKKANFARNAAKWHHAYGGELGNYYDGWGDAWNYLKKGVQKARQKVHDWGLDKSPAQHLQEALTPTADKKYRQNLYNMVDPTSDVPSSMDIPKYGIVALAAKYGGNYPYQRTRTDSVADAAWAKRLGLSYNQNAIIDNRDGTYRLPASNEAEMPTDTLFLKNRIADNQKLYNQVSGMKKQIVEEAIDADTRALNSLRKTYATGEPVEMDEHSYINRNWNVSSLDNLETSPLNVLHRYTMQYDKDNNQMKYWDLYDFNEFEDFVPGVPFKIRGTIDLNKKK